MARRTKQTVNPITRNNLELPKVAPLTDNQQVFFDAYQNIPHHLLIGVAGVGKTFLALYKAFKSLENNEGDSITIFRSSQASKDEGFLPGTSAEKMAVFETPYISNVNKIFHRDDAYGMLKKIGTINFESIAYQRGNTLDNQIVIIDEAQNCTAHQLDTLITRIGDNTRLLICGDLNQQDITKQSEKNVHKVFSVLQSMPSFHTTEFTIDDVVRSGMVKEYLLTKHRMFSNGY